MRSSTVTVVQVTTTTDDMGDSTTETVQQDVSNVLFEPEQSTERTDPRSPGVVTPAKFYLEGAFPLNADDVIVDRAETWWQVIGGASVWDDHTEVPVQRVSEV